MNTTLFMLVALFIGSGQEPRVIAKDLTEAQCITQRDAMFDKAIADKKSVILSCRQQ